MEIITSEYKHWFGELKQHIRQGQIKAAVKVNTELRYNSTGSWEVRLWRDSRMPSGVTIF